MQMVFEHFEQMHHLKELHFMPVVVYEPIDIVSCFGRPVHLDSNAIRSEHPSARQF